MPFAAKCRPEIRMQRLDRDVALVLEIDADPLKEKIAVNRAVHPHA